MGIAGSHIRPHADAYGLFTRNHTGGLPDWRLLFKHPDSFVALLPARNRLCTKICKGSGHWHADFNDAPVLISICLGANTHVTAVDMGRTAIRNRGPDLLHAVNNRNLAGRAFHTGPAC